jgi:hypothetical protein
MLRKFVMGVVCGVIVLASQSGAFAQTTASQTFNVIVDPVLSINAPPSISINHNQLDANQVFPVQGWLAKSNNAIGATVSFSTATCFQAVAGGTTYKRSALMNLAVGAADAGSGWTTVVPTATATAAAPVATVSAKSTAPGDATLNLAMTFVDSDFSALPAATFTTTVTATITAN